MDLRRGQDRIGKVGADLAGASLSKSVSRELQMLVGGEAKAEPELGIVLEQRIRPGRAAALARSSSTA